MFSRFSHVETCICTSCLFVARYYSIVCLVFNAEKHPCGLWTPKNHIPDCPRGQYDSQYDPIMYDNIPQDSLLLIW